MDINEQFINALFEEILEEGIASDKAHSLGLVYKGHGYWKSSKAKNAPTVAKTVGDKLISVSGMGTSDGTKYTLATHMKHVGKLPKGHPKNQKVKSKSSGLSKKFTQTPTLHNDEEVSLYGDLMKIIGQEKTNGYWNLSDMAGSVNAIENLNDMFKKQYNKSQDLAAAIAWSNIYLYRRKALLGKEQSSKKEPQLSKAVQSVKDTVGSGSGKTNVSRALENLSNFYPDFASNQERDIYNDLQRTLKWHKGGNAKGAEFSTETTNIYWNLMDKCSNVDDIHRVADTFRKQFPTAPEDVIESLGDMEKHFVDTLTANIKTDFGKALTIRDTSTPKLKGNDIELFQKMGKEIGHENACVYWHWFNAAQNVQDVDKVYSRWTTSGDCDPEKYYGAMTDVKYTFRDKKVELERIRRRKEFKPLASKFVSDIGYYGAQRVWNKLAVQYDIDDLEHAWEHIKNSYKNSSTEKKEALVALYDKFHEVKMIHGKIPSFDELYKATEEDKKQLTAPEHLMDRVKEALESNEYLKEVFEKSLTDGEEVIVKIPKITKYGGNEEFVDTLYDTTMAKLENKVSSVFEKAAVVQAKTFRSNLTYEQNKELIEIQNDWQNESQYDQPSDKKKKMHGIMNRYAGGPPPAVLTAPAPIYRGMSIPIDKLSKFISNFKVNSTMTMPPSGFSARPTLAAGFANDGNSKIPVMISVKSRENSHKILGLALYGLQGNVKTNVPRPPNDPSLSYQGGFDWDKMMKWNQNHPDLVAKQEKLRQDQMLWDKIHSYSSFEHEKEIVRPSQAKNKVLAVKKVFILSDDDPSKVTLAYRIDLEEASPTIEPVTEGAAAQKAHKMGFKSVGGGVWADSNGKHVFKTQGDQLVALSGEDKKKENDKPVIDPEVDDLFNAMEPPVTPKGPERTSTTLDIAKEEAHPLIRALIDKEVVEGEQTKVILKDFGGIGSMNFAKDLFYNIYGFGGEDEQAEAISAKASYYQAKNYRNSLTLEQHKELMKAQSEWQGSPQWKSTPEQRKELWAVMNKYANVDTVAKQPLVRGMSMPISAVERFISNFRIGSIVKMPPSGFSSATSVADEYVTATCVEHPVFGDEIKVGVFIRVFPTKDGKVKGLHLTGLKAIEPKEDRPTMPTLRPGESEEEFILRAQPEREDYAVKLKEWENLYKYNKYVQEMEVVRPSQAKNRVSSVRKNVFVPQSSGPNGAKPIVVYVIDLEEASYDTKE